MAKKKLVTMKVMFPTMPQALAKLGVDENGDVQAKLTQEVFKNLKDFMPKKTGRLIAGMSIPVPTKVRVEGVYARFLFFGLTRKGNPVNYSKEANPNAGPNWDKRMVAARGKAIAAKVQRYARKRR